MFRYLVLGCLIGVFAFDSGAALAATKLKSISALPRKHPLNKPLDHFTDLAHKYSNNELKIRYIGAGDAIPGCR